MNVAVGHGSRVFDTFHRSVGFENDYRDDFHFLIARSASVVLARVRSRREPGGLGRRWGEVTVEQVQPTLMLFAIG